MYAFFSSDSSDFEDTEAFPYFDISGDDFNRPSQEALSADKENEGEDDELGKTCHLTFKSHSTAYIHVYNICTYLHTTCIHALMYIFLLLCMYTLCANIDSFIHTYIHTYILTYSS